jgi:predicted transcriptional regulator
MTKRRPGLSRRERQIMDVLHRRGEAAVAEVMEDMPDPPSYSAVRATLRILEEKGHVVHREDGPRYVYAPAVPREEARKAALRHVVRTFFGGSAEEAAVALLGMSDVAMTDGDLDRLTAEIERAREEGR